MLAIRDEVGVKNENQTVSVFENLQLNERHILVHNQLYHCFSNLNKVYKYFKRKNDRSIKHHNVGKTFYYRII